MSLKLLPPEILELVSRWVGLRDLVSLCHVSRGLRGIFRSVRKLGRDVDIPIELFSLFPDITQVHGNVLVRNKSSLDFCSELDRFEKHVSVLMNKTSFCGQLTLFRDLLTKNFQRTIRVFRDEMFIWEPETGRLGIALPYHKVASFEGETMTIGESMDTIMNLLGSRVRTVTCDNQHTHKRQKLTTSGFPIIASLIRNSQVAERGFNGNTYGLSNILSLKYISWGEEAETRTRIGDFIAYNSNYSYLQVLRCTREQITHFCSFLTPHRREEALARLERGPINLSLVLRSP